MVQATLAKIKTNTRRLQGLEEINKKPDDFDIDGLQILDNFIFHNKYNKEQIWKKPKFQIGDILWVRESFCYQGNDDNVLYKVDHPEKDYSHRPIGGWKPSIHMPKTAARIFLKVTNVRCERIAEISCEDCKKEGVAYHKHKNKDVDDFLALEAFMELWETINGAKSWNQNPYVFAYDFEVIQKPADF